jgi:PTH1 family peptidyl-tRNA hydrolase
MRDYVLSPMGALDRQIVHDLLPRLTDACEIWIREGVVAAMNKHNRND